MGLIDRLPEHLKTRRTAAAVTAPSAILLAGAGAAVSIVAGLPLLAAAGVGALAWGARVAFALPRKPSGDRIDPFAIGEPWRRMVMGALDAQRRYQRAVRAADAGPLRDRLAEIGDRIDAGVQECWRIARRGDALDDAIVTLDVESVRRELDQLPDDGSAELGSTRAALEAQLASAQRMQSVADDARNRLRLLEARLDESVARAVELSLQASDLTDLSGLGTDVDTVVSEMESLRQGLEEAATASRGLRA